MASVPAPCPPCPSPSLSSDANVLLDRIFALEREKLLLSQSQASVTVTDQLLQRLTQLQNEVHSLQMTDCGINKPSSEGLAESTSGYMESYPRKDSMGDDSEVNDQSVDYDEDSDAFLTPPRPSLVERGALPLYTLPDALHYKLRLPRESSRRQYRKDRTPLPVHSVVDDEDIESKSFKKNTSGSTVDSYRGPPEALARSARMRRIRQLVRTQATRSGYVSVSSSGSGSEDDEAEDDAGTSTSNEGLVEFCIIEADWASLLAESASTTANSGGVKTIVTPTAPASPGSLPPALTGPRLLSPQVPPRLSYRYPSQPSATPSTTQSVQDQAFFFPSGAHVQLLSLSNAQMFTHPDRRDRHVVHFQDKDGHALYACCLTVNGLYSVDSLHAEYPKGLLYNLCLLYLYHNAAKCIQRNFRIHFKYMQHKVWQIPSTIGSTSSAIYHHHMHSTRSIATASTCSETGGSNSTSKPTLFSRMFRKQSPSGTLRTNTLNVN
jgi:hypothetical protein